MLTLILWIAGILTVIGIWSWWNDDPPYHPNVKDDDDI